MPLALGNFLRRPQSLELLRRVACGFTSKVSGPVRDIRTMGCSQSKIDITTEKSTSNDEDEYVEKVLCKEGDLQDNEMKTYDMLEDAKVLLVKQKGKISAIGPKCTHYGAPLVNGALGDGRVRCQWHGACFNILTGDIEDFPGLDSLPCHQVTVDGSGNVKVRAKRTELTNLKRLNAMVGRDGCEKRKIVVIGGGPSGGTCVENLRMNGFKGEITLVCREDALPYDRVKVSKAMDFELDKNQYRDDQFYSEKGINVIKGVSATAVNTCQKKVTLEDNRVLDYDRLYIATGCKPYKPDIPGKDLNNIFVLRDYADSKSCLAALAEDKEVVVLGSSFIALEAANYCQNKVAKTTVVMRGEVPFAHFLGERVGAAVKKLFEEKGILFQTKSGLKKCNGDCNNNVTSVELVDGTILKADVVIMGTGSTYYTDFLKGSGIEMRPDGTIECNEKLQTNIPDVFVGGDIAYAPVWSYGNNKSAIGHYPLAQYQGKIAALNLLGIDTPLKSVPFFWTMLYGKGIRYAGHGKFNFIHYEGDVEGFKFVAYYLQCEEVVAVASMGMDPVVSQFAELLAQGQKLTKEELVNQEPLTWTQRIKSKA
ncbi:apoptosis-inducing factor 3 isoform X3 [Aethina tumida]|uniref:apoptosis-inducing factor 3 isoform X3 n=1 Tax=Aethina tumida TaxID=116153 RepID=UPI00214970BE|nr:apoptosis-inducing factor 3 isoform X3 [Aethina tumida]